MAGKRSRTQRFELRLTPRERAELDAMAAEAGTTRSDVLLSAVRRNRSERLAGVRITAQLMTEVRSIRLELSRQGNNLNQIAYAMNAGRKRGALDAAMLQAASDALAQREAAVVASLDRLASILGGFDDGLS